MHPFVTQAFRQGSKLHWFIWAGLLVIPIAAGWMAFSWLNQMDVGECQSIADAGDDYDSTRLYCAQMFADRRDAASLVQAIKLADSVSKEHPLRSDGDRLIQQWSTRLVELAEATYNDGRLEEAINLLREVPVITAAYASANRRIEDWQTTWKNADAIYDEAQKAIENNELSVAQGEARKLLKVPNQYWQNTRFQDLVNQIQAAREDQKKQNAANNKKPSSPKFVTTNDLMARWNKEQDQEAAAHLQKARQIANSGSVSHLRDAISEAELVFSGTSQYTEAQRQIGEWNRRIETVEDRPYLDRAYALASKGDMASLQAAISEANNIYFGRALYQEAQSKIDQWTAEVRQLSDRQYSQDLPPAASPAHSDVNYSIPKSPKVP